MDEMVLATQKWLNSTYRSDRRYDPVDEDGKTGWDTINTLIVALQIELGIQNTAYNFGPGTRARFQAAYPDGVRQQADGDKAESNVYGIIQGALWCKGYSTGSEITRHFYGGTGKAIRELKNDMGLKVDSTVTLEIMEVLLSMKQFVLLSAYGASPLIRGIQQAINRQYTEYTGIIPCDGLYGREMNTALIQILQSLEGYSPDAATGYIGPGTKSRLKTISRAEASGHRPWLWLAQAALACNGYNIAPNSLWDSSFTAAVRKFQEDYVLPGSGILDVNTWMSLLTSKGNPDRAAKACDTRFEITPAFLSKLKADGYEIVGRYLTGGDFKQIRKGELERITAGGLKYFPIFQENARRLSDFTPEAGRDHAGKARAAAGRLGIPKTVIYFAVDMDILDYQVDSHILPYFEAIHEHLGVAYEAGIYASRNVCSRVADAGYTVSSFVGDMSTGFSGNLGFPIPSNWNYDQFHEISGYGGRWDLDKVAYSGRIPACDRVEKTAAASGYSPPPGPTATDLNRIKLTINQVIDLVEKVEDAWVEFKRKTAGLPPRETYKRVLNYLSKVYLRDGIFGLAVEEFDSVFDNFMRFERSGLAGEVDVVFGANRGDAKDRIGGLVDPAHVAVSTLAYLIPNPAPDFWASWGGDLATGMRNLHVLMQKNPSLDANRAANALIGAYRLNDPYLKDASTSGVSIECNYSDLCSDADSLALSSLLKQAKDEAHILSKLMREYYSTISTGRRYSAYRHDLGGDFSLSRLTTVVHEKMTGFLETLPIFGVTNLAGDSNENERKICCRAFANYLSVKVR